MAKGGLDFLTSSKMMALGSAGVGLGLYYMDSRDGYTGLPGMMGLGAAGLVGGRALYNYGSGLSKKALRSKGYSGSMNRGARNAYRWMKDAGQTARSGVNTRGGFARGFRQGYGKRGR
jgi:hypothetical protein